MSIIQKVGLINTLFTQLDKEISVFQSETNLQCIKGCGKCCTKADLHASPLEFLPWAFHIFMNDKAVDKLEELKRGETPICNIYIPLTISDKVNGRCSEYKHRGLICRLFGFAARRDKYEELVLTTCKRIKTEQELDFNIASEAINGNLDVPIFTDYYMKLSQIDYVMATLNVPINEALILAIEEVLQYYAYRPFPIRLKGVA